MQRDEFLRTLAAAAVATPLSASNQTYDILVLGDSIAWGQGHLPEERFRKKLEAQLTPIVGRTAVHKSYAHSGARIGIGDRDEIVAGQSETEKYPCSLDGKPFPIACGDYGGEVPSATPTILAQLERSVNELPPSGGYDLIVVSAGINDVSILRFIDPLLAPKIPSLIEKHCHYHLAALLDRIRVTYVEPRRSCLVVVLSYFPILSTSSENIPYRKLLEVFLGLTGQNASAVNKGNVVLQRLDMAGPRGHSSRSGMVAAALDFWTRSQDAVKAAVDQANRHPFGPNFVHARPLFTEENALFAPTPWLFNVDDDGAALDPARADRATLCEQVYKDGGFGQRFCKVGSIAHPNAAGAAEGYLPAIVSAVKSWESRPR